MSDQYEYGIVFHSTGEFWRGPMSKDEARDWINVWIADGGKTGVFGIVRRSVGEWMPYE